jgi:glycosyltransferase involved in cell wall biosynthesis
MSDPLVSVVLAVRNGERYLAEALESVLVQEYRPIEVIVVDDGSTDGTQEVARRYPVLVMEQAHSGVADARNRGIEAASGELVAFASHDDLWTSDKLTAQAGYLNRHPEVAYSIGRLRFFLEAGCARPPGFRQEILEGDHIGRIPETLVARRRLFDEIGAFSTDLTVSEDVDWFARASDAGVPMHIEERVLLLKRVHDANISLASSHGHENLLVALRRSIDRKHARAESGDG